MRANNLPPDEEAESQAARWAGRPGGSPTERLEQVLELILGRLGPTLLLMVTTLVASVVTGIVLGLLAAARAGSWRDTLISILALVSYATPLFWLGLNRDTAFGPSGTAPSAGPISGSLADGSIAPSFGFGSRRLCIALSAAWTAR